VKLTAGRIQAFECPKDKDQAYLWCNEVKGLGIRATVHGAKSYFFQAKVKAKSMRVTIGALRHGLFQPHKQKPVVFKQS